MRAPRPPTTNPLFACGISIEKSKFDKIGGGGTISVESSINLIEGRAKEFMQEVRRVKGIYFYVSFSGGDFYENV